MPTTFKRIRWVCDECGGMNVNYPALVNPNTEEVQSVMDTDAYCCDCDRECRLNEIETDGNSLDDESIVEAINKLFPAASHGYPVAFVVDGVATVTSESFTDRPNPRAVDYYGEWRGGRGDGPPWVHPDIENFAKQNDLRVEWDSCAAIHITKKER